MERQGILWETHQGGRMAIEKLSPSALWLRRWVFAVAGAELPRGHVLCGLCRTLYRLGDRHPCKVPVAGK